ncbi:uncharacterized protein LOC144947814 isoform X1 [Lampetra fluviatilis]
MVISSSQAPSCRRQPRENQRSPTRRSATTAKIHPPGIRLRFILEGSMGRMGSCSPCSRAATRPSLRCSDECHRLDAPTRGPTVSARCGTDGGRPAADRGRSKATAATSFHSSATHSSATHPSASRPHLCRPPLSLPHLCRPPQPTFNASSRASSRSNTICMILQTVRVCSRSMIRMSSSPSTPPQKAAWERMVQIRRARKIHPESSG